MIALLCSLVGLHIMSCYQWCKGLITISEWPAFTYLVHVNRSVSDPVWRPHCSRRMLHIHCVSITASLKKILFSGFRIFLIICMRNSIPNQNNFCHLKCNYSMTKMTFVNHQLAYFMRNVRFQTNIISSSLSSRV